MKNSKILLIVICSTLIFCSCSKFQYVTLQSSIPVQSKGFVIENDSVKITYSFKGQNCPVQVEVYNKLEKPVYLDWKKSALIMNEERFSFWEDKTSIRATTISY